MTAGSTLRPNAVNTIASEAGPQFTSENGVPSIWERNGTPSSSEVFVAIARSWVAPPATSPPRSAAKLVTSRRGDPLTLAVSATTCVGEPAGWDVVLGDDSGRKSGF